MQITKNVKIECWTRKIRMKNKLLSVTCAQAHQKIVNFPFDVCGYGVSLKKDDSNKVCVLEIVIFSRKCEEDEALSCFCVERIVETSIGVRSRYLYIASSISNKDGLK